MPDVAVTAVSVQGGRFKKLRPFMGALALALMAGFLARECAAGRLAGWSPRPWDMALLLPILPLLPFFKMMAWQVLTERAGIELPLAETARAWIWSTAGRFMPGKVLFVAGRIAPYGPEPRRLAVAGYLMIVEFAVEVMSATLILLAALLVYPVPNTWRVPLACAAAVTAVMLSFPAVVNGGARLLLRRFKATDAPELALRRRDLLAACALTLCHWTAYLAAIHLATRGLRPMSLAETIYTGGCLSAASLVGTLAVFTPGGLGVRESLLAQFLRLLPGVDFATGLLIASIIRLLQWGGELEAFLLFILGRASSRARGQGPR